MYISFFLSIDYNKNSFYTKENILKIALSFIYQKGNFHLFFN